MLVLLNNRYRVEASGEEVSPYQFADAESQRGMHSIMSNHQTSSKADRSRVQSQQAHGKLSVAIDVYRETQVDSIPMDSFVGFAF
jgi:hypothetical protein